MLRSLALPVLAFLAVCGVDADSIPPVPPEYELMVVDAVELFGPPDLALGNILAYRSSYAGLPSDVSLFTLGERVEEIILAFPANAGSLRREADRVLKRLRVDYGAPTSILRDQEFKTHRWENGHGEMVHTVVYTPGRERHYIRTSGTR